MRFWNGRAGLTITSSATYRSPAKPPATVPDHQLPRPTRLDVLSTNRGVADLGATFADTNVAAAILDRLLHHASVLDPHRRQLPHAPPPRGHQRAATCAPRPPTTTVDLARATGGGTLLRRRFVSRTPLPRRDVARWGPKSSPALNETDGEAAEEAFPRIGPIAGAANDSGGDAARTAVDIPGEKPHDPDISGAKMLGVEHALASPVGEVLTVELGRRSPRTMPNE
jgi:hypothetical protein